MNQITAQYFIPKNKLKIGLTFLLSWMIVAFGQPAWSPLLGGIGSLFGFALFWWGSHDIENRKIKFYLSTLWFMACEAIHLSWMTSTEYQGKYIYIVYFVFLAAFGAQFGYLSLFISKKKALNLSTILLVCGIWVLMEWSRLFILSGFPFNPVGLSLACSLYSKQWASIGGVYFLSFWVVLTNLLALNCFFQLRNLKKWLVFALVASLPYFYGFFHVQHHEKKMKLNGQEAQALLVQTALSPEEKSGSKGFENMMPPIDQWDLILGYLAPYQNQVIDLIVLPETSLPFAGQTKLYPYEWVKKIVHFSFGVPGLKILEIMDNEQEVVDNSFLSQFLAEYFKAQVIVGLEYVEDQDWEDFTAYASAFSYRPSKEPEVYHKRILLPIVEYIPFKWCENLAKRYGIIGWYQRGKGSKVFSGDLAVSPSICIEELYGGLIRKNRQLGSRLFVNITSDVWFPNSKLPEQHFEHGRLRSIENGVPLLRSCNTGVTVGVDALGRTVESFYSKDKKDQWKKGALFVSLPKYSYKTLYLFVGNYFVIFLSLSCIFYYVWVSCEEKQKRVLALLKKNLNFPS